MRRGGALQSYRPLDLYEKLFHQFAALKSPGDVLAFIEKFGPLTKDGLDPKSGELVDGVLAHADAMRELLDCSSRQSGRRYVLASQTNPMAEIAVTFVMDPDTGTLRWQLLPACLLDALWMQAANALSGGGVLRVCQQCGAFFEAGRGAGRRLDAKFCSDEHRVAFNSLKRSGGKDA